MFKLPVYADIEITIKASTLLQVAAIGNSSDKIKAAASKLTIQDLLLCDNVELLLLNATESET